MICEGGERLETVGNAAMASASIFAGASVSVQT